MSGNVLALHMIRYLSGRASGRVPGVLAWEQECQASHLTVLSPMERMASQAREPIRFASLSITQTSLQRFLAPISAAS